MRRLACLMHVLPTAWAGAALLAFVTKGKAAILRKDNPVGELPRGVAIQ